MSDRVTVLTHPSRNFPLAKTWKADGTVLPYSKGKHFKHREFEVHDIAGLSSLLSKLEKDPLSCVIRGAYVGEKRAAEIDPEHQTGRMRRVEDVNQDLPRHFFLAEIDNFEPLTCDPVLDPVQAIDEFISCCMPDCFQGASYHWQMSNSAGHAKNVGKLKAHVWFWLSTAYTSEQLKAWAISEKIEIDKSVLNVVQVHYTSAPIFEEGVVDPVPVRSGFCSGLLDDAVNLVIDEDAIAVAQAASGKTKISRAARLEKAAHSDPRAQMLYDKSMVKGTGKNGELRIVCPREDAHSGGAGESSTVYYPAHTGGYDSGHFKCLHNGCIGIPDSVFDTALGFNHIADDFQVLVSETDDDGTERVVLSRVQSIPEAIHLTTDQANAGRIVANFKARLMVSTERWFAWTGTHWAQDDGEVYRCALKLSKIIHKEADAWEARNFKNDSEKEKNFKIAEALRGWAKKSEMRSTIDAALYLARRMLAVGAEMLDRDPWALNCANGIVDLRTGKIRKHDPEEFITKIIDVSYEQSSKAPMFEDVLSRITMENERGTRPLVSFLQRWFGYCATASTREQKFVVHYGSGRNGKSTILDAIAGVFGSYATTAAPGLLVSAGKDRHPTEIADLFSRRMVTAHESGEGGTLREDFVKQATGSDRIKARFMRGDFFEFEPTHKLQLLTNHKPVIKGQDEGIWRRVILMPYMARFGSPEELGAGLATHLRDTSIAERLEGEKQGILKWIVEGAVEWFREGLNAPDAVLAASKDYQTDQDRMLQFVKERCDVSPEYETSLSGEFGGLYFSYQDWCKESGYHPLAKNRMLQEIERVVPYFRKVDRKIQTSEGRRRDVVILCGLKCIDSL